MMFTYCIFDSNRMSAIEARDFMLKYGDYGTYETLNEAAYNCEADLSEKPANYEGAVFKIASPS